MIPATSKETIFAVVTPFSSDTRASVDHGALRDLLAFLFEHGVRRIVAGGSTGEFSSLTFAERRAVLETCRTAAREHAPTASEGSATYEVIAHVSATSTAEVRELLAHARDHADSALVLPPYYYAEPPADGLAAWFAEVCDSCRIPLYLYNFPRHTGVELAPELINTLARTRNGNTTCLRGVKDSGGDIAAAVRVKQMIGTAFEVYFGADARVLEALELGLDGSVTGAGQPVPEIFTAITSWFDGNLDRSRHAQLALDIYTNARKLLSGITEVAAAKAGLASRIPGFPTTVRPPLIPPTPAQSAALTDAVAEALASY